MLQVRKNLSLICLDPAGHSQTCGYWYLVQENSFGLTAFATFEGLSKWMAERGLNFSQELPQPKTHQYQQLVGSYSDHMHMSYDIFGNLEGYKTKVLSNAEYTHAVITVDDNGHRTVNYLNPNCKGRVVFDYFQTRKEMS